VCEEGKATIELRNIFGSTEVGKSGVLDAMGSGRSGENWMHTNRWGSLEAEHKGQWIKFSICQTRNDQNHSHVSCVLRAV
jgi:hypothetical protein